MDDRELLQQLDALRPNSNDLAEIGGSELQERLASDPVAIDLYERIQSSDVNIATAFRQVDPPVDLEQRIRTQLASQNADASPDSANNRTSAVSPAVSPVLSPVVLSDDVKRERLTGVGKVQPTSRRWLMGLAASALVAAGIAAFILPSSQRPPNSMDELITRARLFYENQNTEPGNPLKQGQAISQFIARGPSKTWRTVKDFLGYQAVAYDMSSASARATLYVVQHRMDGLPTSPFAGQLQNTGRLWLVAWQEDSEDVFYVLVAEPTRGNENPLPRFLTVPWPNA